MNNQVVIRMIMWRLHEGWVGMMIKATKNDRTYVTGFAKSALYSSSSSSAWSLSLQASVGRFHHMHGGLPRFGAEATLSLSLSAGSSLGMIFFSHLWLAVITLQGSSSPSKAKFKHRNPICYYSASLVLILGSDQLSLDDFVESPRLIGLWQVWKAPTWKKG